MLNKSFITAIILGILGAITYYIADFILDIKARESLDQTPTSTVKRVNISEKVTATGFVEPLVSTEIRSEINGKISRIFVKDEDVVKAGDALLELDKTSLQSEETKASNEYRLQKLTLEQAKRDFARQEELMRKGFAILKDFDDAKTTLGKAQIQLSVKESEWEKAKDNLSKTTIVAPQSGTVTGMDLTPGQVIVGAGSVNAGTLLMQISSFNDLYVEVNINEIEVEKIHSQSVPKITFDSMKNVSFSGKILSMSPSAKLENNIRVFPVKVAFQANGTKIRSGISANVEFPISSAENVCAVVLSAVYSDGNVKYVFARREDGSWEKRRVEIGISDIHYVEIKRGLKEGETIALSYPKKNFDHNSPIVDFDGSDAAKPSSK
ncbi:MAG: efflux RND transporter periplasmic adaptor subunit [Opitutales bacterium]|nr:efflux RND transporter periplasmic adaptor subunit [Opitutales bacterium]